MRDQIHKERYKFFVLILISVVTTLTISGVWGFGLYNASISEQGLWLLKISQSQAHMIETLLDVKIKNNIISDTYVAKRKEVIQIVTHEKPYTIFGKTGEFVFGIRNYDKIDFLFKQRHSNDKIPNPIPFSSVRSKPMRMALHHQSGTVIGLDYRNVSVLAAHIPIRGTNIGLVAKIDLNEIRAPYIKVMLYGILSATIVIMLGAFLTLRVSRPIIKNLKNTVHTLNESQRISHLGNWEWDIATNKISWSDEVFRIFGYEPQSFEPTYELFMRSVHVQDQIKVQDAVTQAIDTKSPYHVIHRIVRSDGTERIVVEDGQLTLNHLGHPKAFLGTVQDITKATQNTQAIQESEERYSVIMDGVRDVIYDWNIAKNTLYASSKIFSLLHYKKNEINLTSNLWVSRIHPEYQEIFRSHLIDHLKGNTDYYSCEYKISTKFGEYIWILDRGKALHDDQGRAYRMAGSITDITKRRLSEDGLRQSQKIAAVAELAGGIAHEFRNILVGIGGFTEMALTDTSDKDTIELCLTEVSKASDRASKLTNGLLAFSQYQEMKPTVLTFDIAESLKDMEAALQPLLKKNQKIKLDFSDHPILIDADPSQLSLALFNICKNGLEAMPDGGLLTIASKEITIKAENSLETELNNTGSYGQIFITDTGLGIERDKLERVFNPFYTTKGPDQGAGLGLSAAYGIVDKSNGFINFDSTKDKGSTFTVNIPLHKESIG